MLPGGGLDSGDMGYLVDGELVVTGRRKDMIIANGRNIWPQDLEWSVEQVAGMRSGSVAAFAVTDDDSEERVVLVVECYAADRALQAAMRRDVHATIQKTAGVHCDVVLVAPRSLPYTSSGKLSRAAVRSLYVTGALQPLDESADETAVRPTDGTSVMTGT
jgi:fatty-acyl-CoA synthase